MFLFENKQVLNICNVLPKWSIYSNNGRVLPVCRWTILTRYNFESKVPKNDSDKIWSIIPVDSEKKIFKACYYISFQVYQTGNMYISTVMYLLLIHVKNYGSVPVVQW